MTGCAKEFREEQEEEVAEGLQLPNLLKQQLRPRRPPRPKEARPIIGKDLKMGVETASRMFRWVVKIR